MWLKKDVQKTWDINPETGGGKPGGASGRYAYKTPTEMDLLHDTLPQPPAAPATAGLTKWAKQGPVAVTHQH